MYLKDLLRAADQGHVVEIRCIKSVLNCRSKSVCYFERGRVYDFKKKGGIYVIGVEKNDGIIPIKEYDSANAANNDIDSLEETLKCFELANKLSDRSVLIEVTFDRGSNHISQLMLNRLLKAEVVKVLGNESFIEKVKYTDGMEQEIERERIFYAVSGECLESFYTSFPDVTRYRLRGEDYAKWYKTYTTIEVDIDPAELYFYSS